VGKIGEGKIGGEKTQLRLKKPYWGFLLENCIAVVLTLWGSW